MENSKKFVDNHHDGGGGRAANQKFGTIDKNAFWNFASFEQITTYLKVNMSESMFFGIDPNQRT